MIAGGSTADEATTEYHSCLLSGLLQTETEKSPS
nr:MAG TPA: hypothetical protein [Caudoviricetes sp.]